MVTKVTAKLKNKRASDRLGWRAPTQVKTKEGYFQ